jgi:hypothetical protein
VWGLPLPTKRLFKEKNRYLFLYCVVTIIDHAKGVEGRLTEVGQSSDRRAFAIIGSALLNASVLIDSTFGVLDV